MLRHENVIEMQSNLDFEVETILYVRLRIENLAKTMITVET